MDEGKKETLDKMKALYEQMLKEHKEDLKKDNLSEFEPDEEEEIGEDFTINEFGEIVRPEKTMK